MVINPITGENNNDNDNYNDNYKMYGVLQNYGIVLPSTLPKISFTCTLINCINLASEFALGCLSLFGLQLCIRQLRPQYERQLKVRCPAETT